MKRRRILSRLVLPTAAVLVLILPAAAQAQTVSVGSASGTPGSTVTVAVNFTPGATAVSALSFDLAYPATLAFLPPPPDITGAAALAAGKSASANFHNGVLTILVFGLNQNTIGAGAIAQLRFSISGAAPPGSIQVNMSNASGTDANANPVGISAASGSVTVNSGTDTTPPTISGVSTSNVTGISATVTWTTGEAADSQVEYGITTGYGSATTIDAAMVISHSAGLSGLKPSTTYHYRVKSKDAAGNAAVSTDYTFTTSLSDTTPPTISSVRTASLSASGATIAWATNEQSTSQVEYGTTTGYGSATALNPNLTTSHSVGISGLAPNTLYHCRVKSADASGNVGISGDYTFKTAGGGDTTPPVITGVSSSAVTATGATISWTTNEPADSLVEYGISTAYGRSTLLDSTMVSGHSKTLSGLVAKTVYHYRVRSKDAAGNQAVSIDQTFTTSSSSDTRVPVISNISTTGIGMTGATITWTTDKPANSEVEYGVTTAYGSSTIPDTDLVTQHSQALRGLDPNTRYHYRVKSTDAAGNQAVSADRVFDTAEVPPGTEPAITNIQASHITDTVAVITWTTDLSSTSQVDYGPSLGYGSFTTKDGSFLKSHKQTLTGLRPSTTYYFRAKSATQAGDLAVSDARVFTTGSGTEPIDVQLTLSYPRSLTSAPGGPGSLDEEYIGIALVNLGTRRAMLQFTACDFDGREIVGTGIINPVRRILDPGEQLPVLDAQLFGNGFTGDKYGSVKIESDVRELAGFFMILDAGLNVLDGTTVAPATLNQFVFPEIDTGGYTRIEIANPGDVPAAVTLELVGPDGNPKGNETLAIPEHGALSSQLFADLFRGVIPGATDYVRGYSDMPVVAMEMFGKTAAYIDGLNGQDVTGGGTTLYSPQYVYGGSWSSRLSVVNLDAAPGFVTFRFIGENGVQIGASKVLPIGSYGKIYIDDTGFFGGSAPDGGTQVTQGYVEVAGSGMRMTGNVVFGDSATSRFSSALPLVSSVADSLLYGHVASSDLFFTGISILNPNGTDTIVTIDLYTDEGVLDASIARLIPARQRLTGVLTQFFPHLVGQSRTSGYVRIRADRGVASFALFGTPSLSVLSAIPAQVK